MDVIFVPGGFRFSAQVDEGVGRALERTGHRVRRLCRECLRVIGQGALADLRADVLVTVHGRRFPHRLLGEARFPTVVWLVDEPQEVDLSERYGRHFDIVITNDRNTCGVHGPHKSWYLPLAADPRVHTAGVPGADPVDVTFVGGILPERAELLARAYDLTPEVSWRIVGPDRYHKDVSFGASWDRRCVVHAEYVSLLRASRIVLDVPRGELVSFAGATNRRCIPAVGVGPRVFEATATGRFLLTSDGRLTITEHFPNGEVGLYRHGDAGDLARQVRYYLEREDEREDMAEAGRETCLARHTYPVRVAQLMDIVEQWKATRTPPREKKK